jgi:thiol-disulfide isomerase/thioredoxin
MKWNRRNARFLVPFLVLLVSVVGGWALSRPTNSVDVNLNQPVTTLSPTIGTNASNTGKKFSFVELVDNATGDKGTIAPAGKPMVVNFWFSTCEPCKREFPALLNAAAKTDGDITFVGVNPQDTATAAQDFVDEYTDESIPFIYVRDPNGELLTKLGVGTFPMTLFVDAGGVIVSQRAGEITSAELATTMQKYFGVS